MKTKQIILHLIGEQIRNQLLILTFEKLGFDCNNYTLNISEVILTLVGFDAKSDCLYEQYFQLLEDAAKETSYINLDQMLSKWSNLIYSKLIEIKANEFFSSG
ncbi:hypothetical protein [Maribellus sp. YY47]|uniref:hypothetical protein n=1 Tax=Maribellus sp. YY47 TaxID=2929486 RepID=UPI002001B68B|nr:hypothetical protein [Maribellus sp. YY47]MCK3683979.1 hypothetical protein [Maribellus sp. YY47]